MACSATTPGHHLSDWSSRLLERSPWGWRPGVVLDVDDGWIDVECPGVPGLVPSGVVRAWHHEVLTPCVRPSAPVAVHERHHALRGASGTINIFVVQGLGSVPDPIDFDTWASDRGAEVSLLR